MMTHGMVKYHSFSMKMVMTVVYMTRFVFLMESEIDAASAFKLMKSKGDSYAT